MIALYIPINLYSFPFPFVFVQSLDSSFFARNNTSLINYFHFLSEPLPPLFLLDDQMLMDSVLPSCANKFGTSLSLDQCLHFLTELFKMEDQLGLNHSLERCSPELDYQLGQSPSQSLFPIHSPLSI